MEPTWGIASVPGLRSVRYRCGRFLAGSGLPEGLDFVFDRRLWRAEQGRKPTSFDHGMVLGEYRVLAINQADGRTVPSRFSLVRRGTLIPIISRLTASVSEVKVVPGPLVFPEFSQYNDITVHDNRLRSVAFPELVVPYNLSRQTLPETTTPWLLELVAKEQARVHELQGQTARVVMRKRLWLMAMVLLFLIPPLVFVIRSRSVSSAGEKGKVSGITL
jgi:hypothetical protein